MTTISSSSAASAAAPSNHHADFAFVDAIYRPETIPMYTGNPYIEALPALPSDQELMKALAYFPDFSAAERELQASVRIQLTSKVRKLFVPIPRVVQLARAVLKMVRDGYSSRNPFSQSDRQNLQALYALQQGGTFTSAQDLSAELQRSLALIGSSGLGKSISMNRIAGLLPPVIFHPSIGKWQIPFIFLEMAYDGKSVHTMATMLAEELDKRLPGGNYVANYVSRRSGNAEVRLATMLRIAYEHGVGMIVVDEAQNQLSLGNESPAVQKRAAGSRAAKVETPLMKLLITAANRGKVPLLFVGTTELHTVAGTRFTKSRRMSGRGSADWAPLAQGADGRGEFDIVLRALMRYQWTKHVIEYSQSWSDVFFRFSQGLTDILTKLWESCQETAISTGLEQVTPELVAKVFKDEFSAAEFGITALKNKDRLALDIASDLFKCERRVEDYSTSQYPLAGGAISLTQAMPSPEKDEAAKRAAESVSAALKPASSKARTKRKQSPAPSCPEPADIPDDIVQSADLRGASDSKKGDALPPSFTVEVEDMTAQFSQ
jgi:AAA domain